jgi:hypothetical protein
MEFIKKTIETYSLKVILILFSIMSILADLYYLSDNNWQNWENFKSLVMFPLKFLWSFFRFSSLFVTTELSEHWIFSFTFCVLFILITFLIINIKLIFNILKQEGFPINPFAIYSSNNIQKNDFILSCEQFHSLYNQDYLTKKDYIHFPNNYESLRAVDVCIMHTCNGTQHISLNIPTAFLLVNKTDGKSNPALIKDRSRNIENKLLNSLFQFKKIDIKNKEPEFSDYLLSRESLSQVKNIIKVTNFDNIDDALSVFENISLTAKKTIKNSIVFISKTLFKKVSFLSLSWVVLCTLPSTISLLFGANKYYSLMINNVNQSYEQCKGSEPYVLGELFNLVDKKLDGYQLGCKILPPNKLERTIASVPRK